jgi:hypothetical protein
MPFINGSNSNINCGASVGDSSEIAGYINVLASSNVFSWVKYDASNFGLSTGRKQFGNFFYSIAA